MSFASLVFLFFFLPLVLVGYYRFPRRWRNPFLLVSNLLFYGWGEPWFLPVILLTAWVNWRIAQLISHSAEPRARRFWLRAALLLDFGMLAVFKYTAFVLDTVGLGWLLATPIPLPLGISFYTFQVVSYVVDVYRETADAERRFVPFATYMTFFPQMIAGPIVRYDELRGQLAAREETWDKLADGFCLLLVGFGKKILLANPMGQLWDGLRALPDGPGLVGAWLGAAAFSLQIYFDFSGYSDMARGLGRLFGFELPENFRYPYTACSIKDFWRRWHITLSRWFRDYVYIPLGGSRRGAARTVANLLIVWALTGLWHGAAWNYVLWGLYYFALLFLERQIGEACLARLPRALRHVLTLMFVMLGWVLFAIEDFGALGGYLCAMFSLSGGLLSPQAAVWTLSYLPLLAIAGFACLPFGARLLRKWRQTPLVRWGAPLCCLLLLVMGTAALVAQSYNPFLYFRF